MEQEDTSCTKCVGDKKYNCIKYGKTNGGKQRYQCKACGKTFLLRYTNRAWVQETNTNIVALLKEGCGIRSIARLLYISPATVQRRILRIAKTVHKPILTFGHDYEVDEMCTFIGNKNKKYWIAYALCRQTGRVADFRIGKRNNKTLKALIETLSLAKAAKVYTDGLPNYKKLIAQPIHKTCRFGTNCIERMNLTLRTHLKRLNRRTICFSRSWQMLNACLKLYFWESPTVNIDGFRVFNIL